jgi:alcohol dehydrogenase class IV
MSGIEFQSRSHAARIYSGLTALDYLPGEVERLGARRVFLISGRTVAQSTPLVAQIETLLGTRYAGKFTDIARHATESSLMAAVHKAEAAGADCLVAVGAGTACMAARIISISLAEKQPLRSLATCYSSGRKPVSPRLKLPKIPIVNVLTAPTAAQNGAGATFKSTADGERLEVFDPKTRAAAIFWDARALGTAPAALSMASGLSVFWFSLMRIGAVGNANPLVQADREHSWRLALGSLDRMGSPVDSAARIEMCVASYLLNRDSDHGGLPFEVHWVARICYALGASVMGFNDAISPAHAYIALTGPAISYFGHRNLPELREMCSRISSVQSTELSRMDVTQLRRLVDDFFASKGFSARLRDFGVRAEHLPGLRDAALRNFNADRHGEFVQHIALIDALLEDAL